MRTKILMKLITGSVNFTFQPFNRVTEINHNTVWNTSNWALNSASINCFSI